MTAVLLIAPLSQCLRREAWRKVVRATRVRQRDFRVGGRNATLACGSCHTSRPRLKSPLLLLDIVLSSCGQQFFPRFVWLYKKIVAVTKIDYFQCWLWTKKGNIFYVFFVGFFYSSNIRGSRTVTTRRWTRRNAWLSLPFTNLEWFRGKHTLLPFGSKSFNICGLLESKHNPRGTKICLNGKCS